jgi:hypothetical protein
MLPTIFWVESSPTQAGVDTFDGLLRRWGDILVQAAEKPADDDGRDERDQERHE